MDFSFEKIVKEPTIFRVGSLPAHSDHEYYSVNETRLINDRLSLRFLTEKTYTHNSAFREYLNGVWKFAYAVNPGSVIPGFETPDFDCRYWEDIHVPAHLQMEGYGVPHYTNTTYPWDAHEQLMSGECPEKFNPVGMYVKYFNVPARMQGQKLFISFQGVESGYALFLNGNCVGYAENTFSPSDFELTDYLVPGENKLALIVYKWTPGSWCEDQDFFRFSGIYRDVYLYTKPAVHIDDMKILADADGKLSIELDSTAAGSAHIALFAPETTVPCFEADMVLQQWDNRIDMQIPEVKLWSAEDPYLYRMILTISDANGSVCEVIPELVGFRTFELTDGLMKINGQRVVFRGVNRHEFSTETGRAISYAETLTDLINIKQNNMNALRTSHYPNNSYVYRLCDVLGLYVIDENNMESHGSWGYSGMDEKAIAQVVPGDNKNFTDMMLDRVNSTYQRDKNHPSVIIWSCGNESFGGNNIWLMSELFRKLDPTRPVHYEGICHDRRFNDTSDMESQMYPSVKDIEKFLEEHPDKPFICCEYTHSMGNSNGAMKKYTDLADREPRYQGGFIWDYIDQSLTSHDRYGNEFQAYGGDFGDRPSDYEFSGNGIAFGKDRISTPKMAEVKFNYQAVTAEFIDVNGAVIPPSGTTDMELKLAGDNTAAPAKLRLTNKNLFVDLSAYTKTITLAVNGEELLTVPVEINAAPMSAEEVVLPTVITDTITDIENNYSSYAGYGLGGGIVEYTLTAKLALSSSTLWAPAGHEIAFGQIVKKVACEKCCKPVNDYSKTGNGFNTYASETASAMFVISEGRSGVGVRGENYEIVFGGNGPISYRKDGKEMLTTIPKPSFWRAPISNDTGSKMPARYAQWKIADLYAMVTSYSYDIAEDRNLLVVKYTYTLPVAVEAKVDVTYTVTPGGLVTVNMNYDPVAELHDMPVFGLEFKTDADFEHLTWYGYGPEDTYVDRCGGSPLGLYTEDASKALTPYLMPQESGNHCGVRAARLTNNKGRGIEITGKNIELSVLPWTSHEIENARHHFELPAINYTVVRAALSQMGVGGDDSWGSKTHPEYLIDVSRKIEFSFSFRMI